VAGSRDNGAEGVESGIAGGGEEANREVWEVNNFQSKA